jgi:fatty acid desaturase
MTDFKAVSFLIFASLVMLGAVLFVKWQGDIFAGIAAIVFGIFILSLFTKVVAKSKQ